MDYSFFKDKKVLITGHTGFKGSWLCKILSMVGANVIGYGLEPPTVPSLFEIAKIEENISSYIGDIRDFAKLSSVFLIEQPEIVIHMAAQPLVKEGYKNPVYTYETNVMGTVNVMECVRNTNSVRSVLNVTTDKVYRNNEWEWGYREEDFLDGYDPYSNSKSCSELVTHSYINSYFKEMNLPVSTARAGNVIGGGDFAANRIIPDCVRAATNGEIISVYNPNSVRPYQHVLEPLFMYLNIVKEQYNDRAFAGFYNVGPDDCDCVTTGNLADLFCKSWGDNVSWNTKNINGPHEANFLKLDCSKIKSIFGWKPTWHIEDAVKKTVEWSRCYNEDTNVCECMEKQIKEFIGDCK